MASYDEAYRRSLADPEEFWLGAAQAVDWVKAPTRALDDSRAPLYQWYPDGVLNTSYNALDRHAEARRRDRDLRLRLRRRASPVQFSGLRDEVARFAGALRGLGIGVGDRVVIYLPMVPQAVIAMLACARLGAVHSVVFGGFAPRELAARIDDARPKVLLCGSCGIEPTRIVEYKPIVDEALRIASHRPDTVVVLQREQARATLNRGERDWDELVNDAVPAEWVPVAATDPLYVLYTSGTTGTPRGSSGTTVDMLSPLRGRWPTSTTSAPATCGGQPPMLAGWSATPTSFTRRYWSARLPSFTRESPSAHRTPGRSGVCWPSMARRPCSLHPLHCAPSSGSTRTAPNSAGIDLSALSTLFLAGERLDPETYRWATDQLGVPVVDHWWQTETGWPITANLRGLEPMPIKAGSSTVPVPGYDVRVLDQAGSEVPAGVEGAICIRLPLPPGTLPTLWGDDERYVASYLARYPGYYLTGDGGYRDSDGYLFVMGRTDDVINVAGHRLSTGSMEAVLAANPAVAECAVIGVADPVKGQVPRGLVVLKAGVDIEPQKLRDELVAAVRAEIGPVAAFKDVDIVPGLPKTRSGKILRKSMRSIAEGREEPVPSTIEDPGALDALRPVLLPARARSSP